MSKVMYICQKAKECKEHCITHHNVSHKYNEGCNFDHCIEFGNCVVCIPYVDPQPEPQKQCTHPNRDKAEPDFPAGFCLLIRCSECEFWKVDETQPEPLRVGMQISPESWVFSKEALEAHDTAIRKEFAEKLCGSFTNMGWPLSERIVKAHIRAMAEGKE